MVLKRHLGCPGQPRTEALETVTGVVTHAELDGDSRTGGEAKRVLRATGGGAGHPRVGLRAAGAGEGLK